MAKPPPPDNSQGARRQGLTHRTLTGFFWSFSGTGAQAVLQLVVFSILARLVAPAAHGVVTAALVVVSFTSIFSQLGVGPALVQRPQLEPRHIRTGFALTLLLGLLLTALIQLTAPAIAGFFREIAALTPVLRVLSLVFLIHSTSVVAEFLLQRQLQFRLIAGIQVTSYALGYGAIGITLALLGYGVWALVAAHLAQAGLASILFLIAQPHPKALRVEGAAARDLLYFGGGFTLARIFNQLALQGDNLVVGRWLGAAALGFYGRAYQLMAMPANLFGKVLDKVLFPAMAQVQDNPTVLAGVYRRGVGLIALLVLPVSALLLVLAPEFITVLLGSQWQAAIAPFQILAAGMLFRTSYKMSDSLARSTGAVYNRAWRQGIYAAAVFAGAWLGQRWGLSGVAWGVLAALVVNFVLMAQLSLNLTGMSWRVFLLTHVHALRLAALVALESWLLALFLRYQGAPPLVVLAGVGSVTALTLLVMLRLSPAVLLGQDGVWLLKTLAQYLPERLGRKLANVQPR